VLSPQLVVASLDFRPSISSRSAPMDKQTAKEIERIMRETLGLLDHSIEIVMDNCDDKEFNDYRRLVGKLMGEIHLEIICPIHEQYDDLVPDALRSPK
jgi:hypothetical protein